MVDILRRNEAKLPGLATPRAVGALILVVGFVASAVAVMPAFDDLMRAPRLYLVVASLLGLVALTAGLVALLDTSKPMLAVLAATMAVLWVIEALRHSIAAGRGRPGPGPSTGPADSGAPERERLGVGH